MWIVVYHVPHLPPQTPVCNTTLHPSTNPCNVCTPCPACALGPYALGCSGALLLQSTGTVPTGPVRLAGALARAYAPARRLSHEVWVSEEQRLGLPRLSLGLRSENQLSVQTQHAASVQANAMCTTPPRVSVHRSGFGDLDGHTGWNWAGMRNKPIAFGRSRFSKQL